MARKLKVSVGGLNIRIHPHNEDRYNALMQALYSLRRPVKIRGDRFGMITQLDRQSDTSSILRGRLRTFTKIDANGTWFDEASLADADDNVLRKISIPQNVHPNSAAFRFSLNLRNHIITFERYADGKQLTANSAFAIFRGLCDEDAITDEFGAVKLTILQEKESLDRIFNIARIRNISFVLDRPNPDIWSVDFEEKFDEHLEEAHAQQIEISYSAPVGDTIVETASLRRLGVSALENGKVTASGYDNGVHVTVSTLESPRINQTTYDPDEYSEETVFEELRQKMEARRQ
jgi:hypothetical protein